MAAGEALSNAAEHGLTREGGSFTVECKFESDALVVEIRDTGRGFAPRERRVESLPSRGFGMTIMRALVNELSYSENGTVVRLVRRCTSARRNGGLHPT
ncbi:MAG: hypothetical protein NVSMB31_19450 [Vulcanimicrobiaceae bacterium]